MSLKRWQAFLLVFISILIFILPFRYFNWLEPLELGTLDKLFQLRSVEPTDERIVIVGITEKDIQKYKTYPFTDRFLANLIDKIRIQKPIAIGLDIIRDVLVPPGTEKLNEIFKTTPNLIGAGLIGSINNEYYHDIAFPPILKAKGQVGDVSGIVDSDRVVRRGSMYSLQDSSADSQIPSLGLVMAYRYLETKGIKPKASSDGWLQIKDTVFYPFREREEGYQIFINWRSNFPRQVSVSDVLEGKIPLDFFQNKLVFIGGYASSLKDGFSTPFGWRYGVEIQGSMTSQVISSVLEGRGLIRAWDSDYLYLIFWGIVASIAVRRGKIHLVLLVALGAIIILSSVTYVAFTAYHWWLPLAYPVGAIVIGTIVSIAYIYLQDLKNAKTFLESQVQARTLELSETNRELVETLEELKQTQLELVAKEKLASLGTLTAGLAHEISNPLFGIGNNINQIKTSQNRIREFVRDNQYFFNDYEGFPEEVGENLVEDRDRIEETVKQLRRARNTLQTILAYARREVRKKTEINVNDLLEEAITSVRQAKSDASAITIETNYANLDRLEVFANDLQMAFINLIDNAWDAALEKMKAEENFVPLLAIETEKNENNILVKIKDNGLGIAEENQEKIFDPFFSSKKDEAKGTGLGLYFVWEIIVNEHGGTISVESVEGEETEFMVTIPIRERNNRN